jgi:hypothetical protein
MSENAIRSFTFTPADGVPPAVAPFAHATAAGPTLYVTGQMPTDVTGAVVGDYVAIQTDQVLRNLMPTFSIGMTTARSTPPTQPGFPTNCRRAPVSVSPGSRWVPSLRSTGCAGEATAGGAHSGHKAREAEGPPRVGPSRRTP